jgi:hypothetical protein
MNILTEQCISRDWQAARFSNVQSCKFTLEVGQSWLLQILPAPECGRYLRRHNHAGKKGME